MATASHPVLVLAPLGADAAAITREVAACGLTVRICHSPAELTAFLVEEGAEAALSAVVSEEGATEKTAQALHDAFASEPHWARLPLVFLISDARRPPPAVRFLDRKGSALSFIVLDRPVRPLLLRKVLEALAETRRRQFETRDLLWRLKQEEERRTFLLGELRHRTRNSFAVLRSLFSLSVRRARDLEDFAVTFGARLRNLSNAHARLSEDGSHAAELRDLMRGHVLPYAPLPEQLIVDGPPVKIDERTAIDLAMVVHELATNAAKYGALSVLDGRIEVTWQIDENTGELSILWQERGGPSVVEPDRRGLGRSIVERFPAAPDATELRFEKDGVVWKTRLPLQTWRLVDPTSAS